MSETLIVVDMVCWCVMKNNLGNYGPATATPVIISAIKRTRKFIQTILMAENAIRNMDGTGIHFKPFYHFMLNFIYAAR